MHEQKVMYMVYVYAHMLCIVGMADRRAYDGQQKYTICDACRSKHIEFFARLGT